MQEFIPWIVHLWICLIVKIEEKYLNDEQTYPVEVIGF